MVGILSGKKQSRPNPALNNPGSSFARGRPKAAAAAAISEAIMAAATDVFLSEGFESASMEAIAARAGVTRATLYKRFPDKRTGPY